MFELKVDELLEFTAWERSEWRSFLLKHGTPALELAAGPHGDGRFQTVGDLIRHIFGAEIRYVERLTDRSLTDAASIPDDVEALFAFGLRTRKELTGLLAGFPDGLWNTPRDFKILEHNIRATPKKIVMHVLLHEIRHWAQIATLLRLNGLVPPFHDFLFSPVLD